MDLPESVFKLAYANEKPAEWKGQTHGMTGPLRKTSRATTDRTDPAVNPQQQSFLQMAGSFAALMAGFNSSSSGMATGNHWPHHVGQGSQRKPFALQDGSVEDSHDHYIIYPVCL